MIKLVLPLLLVVLTACDPGTTIDQSYDWRDAVTGLRWRAPQTPPAIPPERLVTLYREVGACMLLDELPYGPLVIIRETTWRKRTGWTVNGSYLPYGVIYLANQTHANYERVARHEFIHFLLDATAWDYGHGNQWQWTCEYPGP